MNIYMIYMTYIYIHIISDSNLGLGPKCYKFRAAVQKEALFKGYLAMFGDINGCEPLKGWLLLASSGWRAKMMLLFCNTQHSL